MGRAGLEPATLGLNSPAALIRRDGYGLLVGTQARSRRTTRRDRRLQPNRRSAPFVRDLRIGLGAEDMPPPTSEQWLVLGASVFDADGEVTLKCQPPRLTG